MDATLPILAGMVSTIIFAGSTLPMLHKAARTRELSSYSAGNIGLANVGNAVHSMYVFNLPPGPIWLLHTFYVVSSAMMAYWYLRYRPRARVDFRGSGLVTLADASSSTSALGHEETVRVLPTVEGSSSASASARAT